MIIDSHCHAGRGQRLDSPWSTNAPLHHYMGRARLPPGSSARSCCRPNTMTMPRQMRRWRASLRAPQRLIGFAVVHAQRDAGRIRQMVERVVKEWKFRGIKVHCYEAPATREVAETRLAFHLPVLYDIVGETWRIEPIAAEYPDVAFILPHLGSFADDWRAHTQVIDQITRIPNVFADTSGVKRFDFVVEAVRRARRTQGALWLGRAVAAPGTGNPKDSPASLATRARGAGLGWQSVTPYQSGNEFIYPTAYRTEQAAYHSLVVCFSNSKIHFRAGRARTLPQHPLRT